MAENVTKLPITNEKQPVKTAERVWAPIDNLRQEIDRLFDDFHPFAWRSPFGRSLRNLDFGKAPEWAVAPAVDMTEKDGTYEITAELPGLDEKNVEVKLANGILTIKGEKTEEKQEEKKDYHLSERRYGSFQRSFRVPDGVDAEKIEANFAKGLLTVKLPKTAEAVKSEKKIEIKAS
jgi:HSP20 family protein